MDDKKDAEAQEVLAQFAPQLRWTVASVARSFNLPFHHYTELRQEAEILVITYAGLMDKPSWMHGALAKWETRADGDERQVKAMLARQLRIALAQIVKRQIENNANKAHLTSTEALIGTDDEPADEGWEYRMILAIDSSRESDRFHRKYPIFAASVLDGFSQEEIAQRIGATTRTVRNRLAREKRQYLTDYLYRQGIRTEGDETEEELMEATNYAESAKRLRLWIIASTTFL